MAIYSLNNAQAQVNGSIIDIGDLNLPLIPPVMIITQSGVNTTQIQGSHDATNWFDFSGGGFVNTGAAKDLILGVRYWRAAVTSYGSGAVYASVGAVPRQGGGYIMPHLLSVSTNATQGQ